MKRIKIFLRLKCQETWEAVREGGATLIWILAIAMGVVLGIWGLVFLLGGLFCFLLDIPALLENIVDFGAEVLLALMVTTAVILFCIATKRWLVSNWEEAGRLAKEDTP